MQGNYQEPQPYQEPPPTPFLIIENVIKAGVAIFLIVLCFFIVILIISVINNQTAVEYLTYSNDFDVTNPLFEQVLYTSNPHLGSIVVTKYNSSNSTFGGVDSADWSFDADTTKLVVNAGVLPWDITGLRVSADTTYSEPPTVSVFSAIAISLIILSIASIFGLISYSQYKKRQQNYLRR